MLLSWDAVVAMLAVEPPRHVLVRDDAGRVGLAGAVCVCVA